jgi:hypothetical protein
MIPAAATMLASCGDPTPGAASQTSGAPQTSAVPPPVTATSEQPPRPASAAELAIVAPAAPGAKLADWDIRAIHGVARGTMDVVCEKDKARVVLTIALAADGGPEPPVSTDRYAVFYSARGATAEDGERLARALADRLRANQAAPPPAGMGPFVLRPRSL